MADCNNKNVTFVLGDMIFEYDEEKNQANTNMISAELAKELAFSEEDIKELDAARNMPIVFDEDCPEVTPEMALMFHRVNPPSGNVMMA